MVSLSTVRALIQQRTWTGRTDTWHEHVTESAGFHEVRRRLLAACQIGGHEHAVDLGAGSGFLTLELSRQLPRVVGVDISASMLERLDQTAHETGRPVETVVADLREFDLPASTVDLVVSNYALHHLSDREKSQLLRRAHGWLRPGGRIVIADMMFGRGASVQDRRILRQKLSSLARKGPGGFWRIAKAAYRYGFRLGTEQPASPDFWMRAALDAGFVDAHYEPVVAEAGLLVCRMPG